MRDTAWDKIKELICCKRCCKKDNSEEKQTLLNKETQPGANHMLNQWSQRVHDKEEYPSDEPPTYKLDNTHPHPAPAQNSLHSIGSQYQNQNQGYQNPQTSSHSQPAMTSPSPQQAPAAPPATKPPPPPPPAAKPPPPAHPINPYAFAAPKQKNHPGKK